MPRQLPQKQKRGSQARAVKDYLQQSIRMREFIFEGHGFRIAENWFNLIPIPTTPIKYLEIGAYCGVNLLSVEASYAAHPDSRLYAIDPWEKYHDYPEYDATHLQNTFEIYKANLSANNIIDKVTTYKGYSNEIVPQLEDVAFDIIYIDGNHEPEYVLEDAVLAFRKLKVGGYLIFDDYGWGGPDLTQRGIDAFVQGYHKRIRVLNDGNPHNEQLFLQRTS